MQVVDTNRRRYHTIGLAAVCLVAQLMVAPYIGGPSGGRMNLALVYAGIVSLRQGGRSAVVQSFVAGLIFDLTSTGPIGLMAGMCAVMGWALGLEERNRFADGYVGALTSFGTAALVVTFLYDTAAGLIGAELPLGDVILVRTLPGFALTFVAFLPFCWRQVAEAGRPHGLSGRKAAARVGGTHYDTRNL